MMEKAQEAPFLQYNVVFGKAPGAHCRWGREELGAKMGEIQDLIDNPRRPLKPTQEQLDADLAQAVLAEFSGNPLHDLPTNTLCRILQSMQTNVMCGFWTTTAIYLWKERMRFGELCQPNVIAPAHHNAHPSL